MSGRRSKKKRYLLTGKHEMPRLISGACLASFFPMFLGVLIFMPYADYLLWRCSPDNLQGRCYKYMPNYLEPELWIFPTSGTLFFATPIVAYICVRYVLEKIREKDLIYSDLRHYAVNVALVFQFLAGFAHLVLGGIFSVNSFETSSGIIFGALLVHIFVAVLITIPLCWICVFIFRIWSLQIDNSNDQVSA